MTENAKPAAAAAAAAAAIATIKPPAAPQTAAVAGAAAPAPLPTKSLFALYAVDVDALENGKWFDDVALGKPGTGIAVKIRGIGSKKSVECRTRLSDQYRAKADDKGNFSQPVEEAMLIDQLAESLVVDWRGVSEKFSVEEARRLLADARMIYFRVTLATISMGMDSFRAQIVEDIIKN